MQKITSQNFKEFTAGDGVLVDFWATWCGPCMMQGEVLETLVKEHPELAPRIGKLNVDDDRELAIEFGIDAIPALLYFRNGQLVDQMVGLQSKEQLVQLMLG